ncbi:MAG: septum formation initiator family protein [Ruthenibacterium sp.]
MKTEKRKKRISFSALALRFGLVFVCGYLAVTLVSTQVEIVTKRRALENINAQVAAQTAQNTELQRMLETGDEAQYYERVARDKLGYARPDEHVFVDMSGN